VPRAYRGTGLPAERECHLPDAERRASVRRGDGGSATDAECGQSVRWSRRYPTDADDHDPYALLRRLRDTAVHGGDCLHPATGLSAAYGAAGLSGAHAAAGVSSERECGLPDAKRRAAVRCVHAVLPAVTKTRGGAGAPRPLAKINGRCVLRGARTTLSRRGSSIAVTYVCILTFLPLELSVFFLIP
jgi:hypothetical protein